MNIPVGVWTSSDSSKPHAGYKISISKPADDNALESDLGVDYRQSDNCTPGHRTEHVTYTRVLLYRKETDNNHAGL